MTLYLILYIVYLEKSQTIAKTSLPTMHLHLQSKQEKLDTVEKMSMIHDSFLGNVLCV